MKVDFPIFAHRQRLPAQLLDRIDGSIFCLPTRKLRCVKRKRTNQEQNGKASADQQQSSFHDK